MVNVKHTKWSLIMVKTAGT